MALRYEKGLEKLK